MQKNKSLTDRLLDFFGFKSSENASTTSSTNSNASSSLNRGSSFIDKDLADTAQNMSWRDLFRPTQFLTQLLHPSSIEREDAKQSGGLLDVFYKNSAGAVLSDAENASATQVQRNEPFSWRGLFNDWIYGPKENNRASRTQAPANQPMPAQNPALAQGAQPIQAPTQGQNISKDQELIQAIENKDENQVTALLNEGANPNALNQYGESALQLAVENGSMEMVDALIEHQADVNKVSSTPEARSPLLVAAERGDEAMVHRLLEAGADAKQKDEQGKTAMHYATSRGMLGDLIEHGGDLMAEDLNGRAPLHDMVARGEYEVIDEALFYGADPSKADINGRTALQEAALNGHESIYQSLQDYMTLAQEGSGANDPNLIDALQERGAEVVQAQEGSSVGKARNQMDQRDNG